MQMRRNRIDLAHFMAHYVPAVADGRFVFTIHDLIHLRFKQYFKAYIVPYYMTVVRRACRKAVRIITSDEKTIADLVHYLSVDPAKIRVIPLAPRERFLRPAQPFASARPYLLYVGNHREHKDIPTLLAAWSSLPVAYQVDLYLTGPDDLQGELQRLSTPARRCASSRRHWRRKRSITGRPTASRWSLRWSVVREPASSTTSTAACSSSERSPASI
jgi:glycosyltransferase involved in cell wall biosynthesis